MHHLLEFDGAARNRRSRVLTQGSERPFVTLSYAQSIDGSIAGPDGNRIAISGRESLAFIHQLRASHQAILVGIRTVIADDPRLTVRYARGVHPQPIVIDTHLRFPKNGFLLKKHPLKPWIFAADSADAGRCRELEKAGARVFRLPLKRNGYLSLKAVLNELIRRGMHRVMVEGGARIITGFLAEQLVNRMVITIAPVFIRGLSVCSRAVPFPRLANIRYRRFGNDVVVQGEPRWERA
jgi:3,4-dihydroxy 2-butanone 4-phosphate synthase/GTP cyclohydrolase II